MHQKAYRQFDLDQHDIRILDADSHEHSSLVGDSEACYLAALIPNPSSYIANARVRMESMVVDGRLLPLAISDTIADNSNICSAYTHYNAYAGHEFAKRFGKAAATLVRPVRGLFGATLRAGCIDRIVFVNNWLLTTNPVHRLSAAQVAAATPVLTRRFPSHAIVFRSINPVTDPEGLRAVAAAGYTLIPSRQVFIIDTTDGSYLRHSNTRADLAILKRTAYSVVSDPVQLRQHAERFAQIYYDLYLSKHTPMNPQYNAGFFSLLFESGFMTHRAFVLDGRVDAFLICILEDNVATASLLAYDLSRPRKLGLLRMLIGLFIAEASQHRTLLNLSAGAGTFKMLRGAVPVQEYDAVYERHLPACRRAAWGCVRLAAQAGRRFAMRSRFDHQT